MDARRIWLEHYYRKYKKMLMKSVRGRLEYHGLSVDQAEEVVHEAYADMYEKFEDLKNYPDMKWWLVKAVDIEVRKVIEKSCRSLEVPIPEDFDMADKTNQIDEICEPDFQESLPPGLCERYRQILTLHIEGGYSHKEISKILGIPVTISWSCLSRAKRRCAKLLQKNKNISKPVSGFTPPSGFINKEVPKDD